VERETGKSRKNGEPLYPAASIPAAACIPAATRDPPELDENLEAIEPKEMPRFEPKERARISC
jgi:hypothetical protein